MSRPTWKPQLGVPLFATCEPIPNICQQKGPVWFRSSCKDGLKPGLLLPKVLVASVATTHPSIRTGPLHRRQGAKRIPLRPTFGASARVIDLGQLRHATQHSKIVQFSTPAKNNVLRIQKHGWKGSCMKKRSFMNFDDLLFQMFVVVLIFLLRLDTNKIFTKHPTPGSTGRARSWQPLGRRRKDCHTSGGSPLLASDMQRHC